MTEPNPTATLCGRVLGKSVVLRDVGTFRTGALMPVTLSTALDVEILVKQGLVEICIGEPSPPIDPIDPEYHRKSQPVALRGRPTPNNWGKKQLKELTAELVGRHLPSYFENAGKTAEEMAADMIEAKEIARAEKPVQRQRESLDRMRAELPKRAERLRQAAAEQERLLQLAEAEASQIDAAVANAGAALDLFELRARFDKYAHLSNRFTTNSVEIRDKENKLYPWIGPVDFDKLRELVRSGILAQRAKDTEALRSVLAELDALFETQLVSDYEPGKRMHVTEAVNFGSGVR